VRWPPKDGQPEPTPAVISGGRAKLEASAATRISRDSTSSATNGKRAELEAPGATGVLRESARRNERRACFHDEA